MDGYQWLPVLTKGPKLTLGYWQQGQPQSVSISYGDIEFQLDAEYSNQDWSTFDFDGAEANVWIGELGQDFSSYDQIFTGTAGPISRDRKLAKITLRGPDATLETNLLDSTYEGTGGAEGDSNLKGNVKPRAFGFCRNIEPVLIDQAYQIYQFHDGSASAVSMVYENALEVHATPEATVSTYTALRDLTLSAGQWAAAPAVGLFRLGGEPRGKVTADVTGDSTAGTTIGSIVPELLKLSGLDSNKIDAASIGAFTQTWNLYTARQVPVEAAARSAFVGVGFLFSDAQGIYRACDIWSHPTATALKEDRSAYPLVRGVKQLASASPNYSVKIGHSRCWGVHSDSEISEAVKIAGTTADEALSAAQTAESTANAANARLQDMADDNVLDRTDKYQVINDYNRILAEQGDIDSKADIFGVSRTAYDGSITALTSYLTSLSPAYIDTSQETAIDSAVFAQKFDDVFDERQLLLNAIAVAAGSTADWSNIQAVPTNISTLSGSENINNADISSGDLNNAGVGDFAYLSDIALDDARITGTVNPYTQISGTLPSTHGWSADGRLVSRPITNVAMTANAYRILASDGGEYYTVRSNVRYAGGMQISGTLPVHEAAHYHGPAIGFTDRETIAANNTEFNYLEYSFVTRYLNAGSGDIQVRDDGNVITVESGLSMADFDSRSFQVRYDGGTMEWLLDDVVVHSRFVGTGLDLWTMITAREIGTGFEAIALTPYGAGAKVAGTNSVLEPDNANLVGYGNVIKKPVGAPNGYDGATSAVSYYRGAVISGKINSNLSSIGLVDDPSPSSNGSDVYFGVFAVNGDVRIEIPNSAVVIGTTADYPLDGEWRIEYAGIEGRAFYNNTLVHTETLDADKTLWGRGIVFLANTELNNVYFSAGQNENWDNIAGAGKPEDNADRTVENTAAGILNQGALAVKNVVEAGDVSLQIGGANLAPDGSFEDGLGTFTQTSGVTAEQSSALALDGGNSMKVTASSTGEATIHNYFVGATRTGLNIEGPLTASIYINPPTAMQVKFRLIGTENGSANFGTDDTADAVTPTLPANTWTRVVAQLPAFANRNGYHIRVGAFGSVTAGDFFYADNFQVEQGDVLTEYKPYVVENATKGADFTTDVTNVPTELTDGRISAGLNSTGDVVRNLPTAIKSQITLDEVSDGTTNRFYTDVEKSKLTGVETGATVGADLLTNVSNKSLANLDGVADTKLTGIETGATAGADFAANVSNVPTELTDGRITAGLDSTGDVVRNLPTAIKSQITLDEVSDGTTNRFYTDVEKSKLTSVEDNATFGAVWGSNITNEPAALSDINSTEGTKLSGVEDNADVSADISGPSASNFRYSSSGVAESGEFSRDFSYDLTLAGSKQTSGNTWTYTILSGSVNGFNASSTVRSMSGSGTGTLTVSSLGSDTAVVEINAVNGSKNAPAHKLTLTRSYAAPNNNGSSGGSTETASQTSGFTSFSSTAFTVVSNELTITAGTTSLDASVAMSVNPPAIGAWTIQAKLQRKISGTWTDFGTARSSVAEREVEPNFVFEYPATFNFTETATITASTTQEVRVLMRYSAGGSNTFNTSGTFEIEG